MAKLYALYVPQSTSIDIYTDYSSIATALRIPTADAKDLCETADRGIKASCNATLVLSAQIHKSQRGRRKS